MQMRIELSTTNASIKMESTRMQMRLKKDAMNMRIHQDFNLLELEHTWPRIEIDQTAAFASAGLEKPIAFARSKGSEGNQEAMADIGRIAAEGVQCLHIENDVNAIAQIGRQKGMSIPTISLRLMPSVGPDIMAIPGKSTLSVDGDSLQISYNPTSTPGSFTPATVTTDAVPRPDISLRLVPGPSYRPVPIPAPPGFNATV